MDEQQEPLTEHVLRTVSAPHIDNAPIQYECNILTGHKEQVYPCRCGETHRGPYAIYDYGHHNCFHDYSLSRLGDDQLMCPGCGKVWDIEEPAAQGEAEPAT